MATIPSNQNFPTSKQIPDHAILDFYNKQTYLGNQFIYTLQSSLSGTSEVPLMLLNMPTTSKVSMFHNLRKLTCNTASINITFRFYFNPTGVSGGTVQAAVNLRPAMTNSTASGVITTSPTVSTNGTLIASLVSSAFAPDVSQVLSIMDPGQSMLITAQPSGSCAAISEVGWFEL